MTKIKCLTLGNREFAEYKGKSGKDYHFHKGSYTKVDVEFDAFVFLNAGPEDSPLFEAEEKESKDELFKKFKPKKKKKVLKEVDELVEPKEEPEIVEPVPEKKGPTYDELEALNKKEQIALIKKLYGKSKRAPKYEKDKIKLILEYYKQEEDK